jgi:hypothetical protein
MRKLGLAAAWAVTMLGAAIPACPAVADSDVSVVYTYLGNHYPPTEYNPLNPTPAYHNEYIITAKPGSVELKQGSYGTVDDEFEPDVHITKAISGATWAALLAAANRLPPPSVSHPRLVPGDYPTEAELYHGDTSVRRGFYGDAATEDIHKIFLKVFEGTPGLSPTQ